MPRFHLMLSKSIANRLLDFDPKTGHSCTTNNLMEICEQTTLRPVVCGEHWSIGLTSAESKPADRENDRFLRDIEYENWSEE